MMKKLAATLCATLMVGGTCLAMSGCNKNGGPTDFSVWIPNGESSSMYSDYAENPVVKYLEQKEWAGEKLSFTWKIPSKNETPRDNIARALSTETYTDIIDASNITSVMSIDELYNEGIILDLTEYVDKYMPNYKKFLADNPELTITAQTLMSDGSRKHLQLWGYQGEEDMWGGWNYRRDWIVKYGTNPSTGEKFSGSWDSAKKNWTDDVYFPSWYDADVKAWYLADVDPNWDGQIPVTIDDWAWMLGIFSNALKNEGITDGYAMQLYGPGYYELGDLITSFGGGGGTWYLNSQRTQANFGLTSQSFRLYTQCINDWYKAGYIDKAFDQKTELFYEMDTDTVYSGRVGLWYGYNSALCDALDKGKENSAANGYTKDIVVFGARQPINTSYGTAEYQKKIPTVMYQTNREMRSFVITDKAKDKNLEALFTMMDYFYTEEGTQLNSYGMTKEQYEEYKQLSGKTDKLYEQVGGELFTKIDGKIKYNDSIRNDDDFQAACRGSKLWGLQNIEAEKYHGDDGTKEKMLKEYVFFRNKGEISKSMLNQLSAEKSNTFNTTQVSLRNYAAQNYPTFVRNGMTDISWRAWCAALNNTYKVDEATKIIQDLLNELNG